MNKKFLSAVLFGAFMIGSTVTFTGCIDNDEPAGIENLRGAKAELLRAKVAVEAAKAAYKNAQATEMLAQARQTEALALQAELRAKEMELDNALKEAQNAEKIAAAEAEVARIKAQLERDQLDWETQKLTSQKNLAEAQKAYEDAMKALELSKTYLSQDELTQLTKVQTQLTNAKNAMEAANATLKTAFDTYKVKVTNPENYINEATLQEDLLNAQTTLEKASNKLAVKKEALAALESNDAYNGWLALKAKYNEKLDSLNAVLADKNNKNAEIIASETKHSIKGLQEAIKTMDNIITNKSEAAGKADSTFTVSAAIKGNLDPSKFTGFVGYSDGIVTAKFKSTPNVLALTKTNSNDEPDDLDKADKYATLMDNTYGFNEGGAYKTAVKNINDAIAGVNAAKAAIDANEMAYAKEVQAAAKKAMDDQKKVADAAIKVWNDAVTAYNSGTSYTQQEYDEAYGAIQILLQAVKDGTTGYTTDAQIKSVYDKYISFRAVMAANGQELPNMPKDITNATTLKNYLSNNEVTTLLPSKYTEVDLAANLLTAAQAAFGNAGVYDGKGVLVRPADDNEKMGGAQGAYLAAVVAYNTATENVEKVAQFDKVIAQLNTWKSSLAIAKTAYTAKYQTNMDAVTAAQKAVTEKVANPIKALMIDATDAMKTDIELVIKAIDGKEIKEYETIIKDLKDEIGDKKGVNGADKSTELNLAVEDASNSVLKAEKMIELFKAGNLSEIYVIEWAKEELDRAKATYESKVSVFNYWNGKLEEMTAALYGKASAE